MNSNKTKIFITLGALALASCAHTVPGELLKARAACERSHDSAAAELVPAELHLAQTALVNAEQAYVQDWTSFQTRDLSYVAERKCQKALALANIAAERGNTAEAKEAFSNLQGEIVDKTKASLSKSEDRLSESQDALNDTQKDLNRSRTDLNKSQTDLKVTRSALMVALARLAAVKEEARGLVITLSGSVLFRTNESTLLPSAQTKLNEVADALLTDPGRTLVVEGHTDSHGGTGKNQDLSLRRADSVRTYLIGRGYAAKQIVAVGKGEGSPVANNNNPEGRSNNRRVEIVVQPAGSVRTGSAQ